MQISVMLFPRYFSFVSISWEYLNNFRSKKSVYYVKYWNLKQLFEFSTIFRFKKVSMETIWKNTVCGFSKRVFFPSSCCWGGPWKWLSIWQAGCLGVEQSTCSRTNFYHVNSTNQTRGLNLHQADLSHRISSYSFRGNYFFF